MSGREQTESFRQAITAYTATLKDSEALLGVTLVDIFLAGFRFGLKTGRQEAYRALNTAIENIEKSAE